MQQDMFDKPNPTKEVQAENTAVVRLTRSAMTYEDRVRLKELRDIGVSVKKIIDRLNFSSKTSLIDELKAGGNPYCPKTAHENRPNYKRRKATFGFQCFKDEICALRVLTEKAINEPEKDNLDLLKLIHSFLGLITQNIPKDIVSGKDAINQIKEMLKQGTPDFEISTKLGVTIAYVRKIRKIYDIKPKKENPDLTQYKEINYEQLKSKWIS